MKQLFTILLCNFLVSSQAQNVGIGTTSPTDQLHTTGGVRLQKLSGPTTRMLQIDSSGRLIATAAGAIFANTSAQAITDNGCTTGTGINSSITISGQPSVPIQTSRIAVRVNITHPYVGDLRIYLFPPSINVLTLYNGSGGAGDNFINTIFTDQAPSSINTGAAPFTGQYKPMGGVVACNIPNTGVSNFSALGGGTILPNGTWTLRVFDAAGGDVGTLNSWSISFTGPESITTADENNFIPKLVGGNLLASNIYQPLGSSNIGIGTTNPIYLLDVNGRPRLRYNGASAGMWYNKIDNTEAAFAGMVNDTTFGFFGGNGWSSAFDIKNNLLGVGVLDPTAPLSFPNSIGNKIALWGDATGGHYGLGIQGSLLQMYSGGSNADIAFGYGNSATFTENMRVKGNGNVGIGTINPNSKLEVAGNNNTQTTYFTQLGSGKAISTSSTSGTSIDAYSAVGSAINASNGPLSSTAPVILATSTSAAPAIVANGKIKINDGTQAAGKVLTSDVAGNASWQAKAQPYENIQRFYFRDSKFSTNSLVYSTVYNYGNSTYLAYPGTSGNIYHTITPGVAGLYHLEFNWSFYGAHNGPGTPIYENDTEGVSTIYMSSSNTGIDEIFYSPNHCHAFTTWTNFVQNMDIYITNSQWISFRTNEVFTNDESKFSVRGYKISD